MKSHTRMLRPFLTATALSFSLITTAHAQGISKDQMDIAGIKLGMTEAEALEAIAKIDPELRIERRESVFTYRGDWNLPDQRTPEFLDRLNAQKYSNGNYHGTPIVVHFASPPMESRVIGITRQISMPTNPPTQEQFLGSLNNKYGPPIRKSANISMWQEAGKPNCIIPESAPDYLVATVDANSMYSRDRYFETINAQLSNPNSRLPEDPSTCGAYLSYFYQNSQLIDGSTASIIDAGAIWESELKSSEWIESLIAEELQKARTGGEVPNL